MSPATPPQGGKKKEKGKKKAAKEWEEAHLQDRDRDSLLVLPSTFLAPDGQQGRPRKYLG